VTPPRLSDHALLVLLVQSGAHPELPTLKAALARFPNPELDGARTFVDGFQDIVSLLAELDRRVQARGGREALEGMARGMEFDDFMAGTEG